MHRRKEYISVAYTRGQIEESREHMVETREQGVKTHDPKILETA